MQAIGADQEIALQPFARGPDRDNPLNPALEPGDREAEPDDARTERIQEDLVQPRPMERHERRADLARHPLDVQLGSEHAAALIEDG